MESKEDMSDRDTAKKTCEVLFKGLEGNLRAAIKDLNAGQFASNVAREHIQPVIARVEKNAGQQMDPAYVAYLIEFAHIKS